MRLPDLCTGLPRHGSAKCFWKVGGVGAPACIPAHVSSITASSQVARRHNFSGRKVACAMIISFYACQAGSPELSCHRPPIGSGPLVRLQRIGLVLSRARVLVGLASSTGSHSGQPASFDGSAQNAAAGLGRHNEQRQQRGIRGQRAAAASGADNPSEAGRKGGSPGSVSDNAPPSRRKQKTGGRNGGGGGKVSLQPSASAGRGRSQAGGGRGRKGGRGEKGSQGSSGSNGSDGNGRRTRQRPPQKGLQQSGEGNGNGDVDEDGNARGEGGSSGGNCRSGGNGSGGSPTRARKEKERWASPLTQFRQESQGLIGRYRSPKTEGQAPLEEFGFAKGFLDKYFVDTVLGRGTFGVVSVCTHKETRERCAVKRLEKKYVGGTLEGLFAMRVQNEVDILGHLGQSLNVAHLYQAYEDKDNVYLVMQLCEGGELWQIIQSGRYTERAAARVVRQILQVVAQCAAKGVLFRDVKPENFLFLDESPDSVIKAIDFGLAEYCKKGEILVERAGTPVYIAPEVLKMHYGLKADVWSAGITAYQLLTGRLPFYGEEGLEVSERYMNTRTFNNKDVFRAVLYADLDFCGPPWDEISPAAKDLIMKMLQRDPNKRLSAAEALEHPWLQEDRRCDDKEATPFSDSIVQRLQRFGTYGRLKQMVLRTVVSSIASNNELVADLQVFFCRAGLVQIRAGVLCGPPCSSGVGAFQPFPDRAAAANFTDGD
mmetsp:Transcript_12971/g.36475  ORF Transcript_12971/g.36475 Transcript_12971/m.36475 type:complete len:713 (-) Transcript_12971:770-2908(-)